MVYFIADTTRDVVKIGFSKDPRKRLRQLQTSNSNVLVLLGYMNGNKKVEKQLHLQFENYKENGEWFRLDKNNVILNYINENNLLNYYVDRINGEIYRLNKIKNF